MFNNVLLTAAALLFEAMCLLFQFYNHLFEEDRVGCFTVKLIVVLLYMRVSLFVFVLMSLPRGIDK